MKTLQQFKDALKAILDKQEKQDDLVNKCLLMQEVLQKARRVYGIGDKATWGGKTYVKGNDKKWRRLYDKAEGRGAKIVIGRIKRAIDDAQSNSELMEIVKKHKGRFSYQDKNELDENGEPKWKPLPIVEELHASIDNRAVEIKNNERAGYKTIKRIGGERISEVKGKNAESSKILQRMKAKAEAAEANEQADNTKTKQQIQKLTELLKRVSGKQEDEPLPNLDEFIENAGRDLEKLADDSKSKERLELYKKTALKLTKYPFDALKTKLLELRKKRRSMTYGGMVIGQGSGELMYSLELLSYAIERKMKDPNVAKEVGQKHAAARQKRSDAIARREANRDDEVVGTDYPCYDTMPDDEKKFYTMTRAEIKSYMTENIVDEIQNVEKAETKTLADFCRAHTRVKTLIKNLPKLKFFNGYKKEGSTTLAECTTCSAPDRRGIFACQRDMTKKCEAIGVENDANRSAGKIPMGVDRDEGNGTRDVFIHEFGHNIDDNIMNDDSPSGVSDYFDTIRQEALGETSKYSKFVSTYAKKDRYEFTAECFASYVIHGKASLTQKQADMVEEMINAANKVLRKSFTNTIIHKSMEVNNMTDNASDKEGWTDDDYDNYYDNDDLEEDGCFPSVAIRREMVRKAKRLKNIIATSKDPKEVAKAKHELECGCFCY